MAEKHIVLVDDEAETRRTFAIALRAAGYMVTEAENGRIALKQIAAVQNEEQTIDLLVTDIWMEELDGLQLIDQINKLGLHIPVLAITGYGDKETVIELMQRGCSDYLEKPFESTEFLAHVAKILEKTEQSS